MDNLNNLNNNNNLKEMKYIENTNSNGMIAIMYNRFAFKNCILLFLPFIFMNQSNKRIIHVITSNRTMKFKVPNETSANKKIEYQYTVNKNQ